jgi:hypothetical protein
VPSLKSTGKYHNRFQGAPGGTPDISHIVMFYWFEPVLYLDPVVKFPETTEKNKPGFFIGFVDNVGDVLTLKILKNDLIAVLYSKMKEGRQTSS